MEDQIRRGREETKGAREMVGRVREALERVAAGDEGDERALGGLESRGEANAQDEEDEEKMVWRVLEREVGFT